MFVGRSKLWYGFGPAEAPAWRLRPRTPDASRASPGTREVKLLFHDSVNSRTWFMLLCIIFIHERHGWSFKTERHEEQLLEVLGSQAQRHWWHKHWEHDSMYSNLGISASSRPVRHLSPPWNKWEKVIKKTYQVIIVSMTPGHPIKAMVVSLLQRRSNSNP